jgi:hypothetical protein
MDTVWATGFWPDGFWADGFWSGEEAPPVEVVESNSGGWGFFLRYEEERDRRRRRKRELEEAEEAVQELPPVDKEIAQFLHKQEREDEKRAEVARLKALVDRYADEGIEKALNQRAKDALKRLKERNSFSSTLKFEKELRRQLEEEEMAFMLMLLND